MNKLSKTAKTLDTVFRILFWFMIVCAVAATIAALVPLLLRRPAPDGTTVSVDLDFIKLHLARPTEEAAAAQQNVSLATMLMLIAFTGIGAYCTKLMRNILKPMIAAMPFHETVSVNLKKLAWLELIGGAVVSGAELAMNHIIVYGFNLTELFLNDKITQVTLNYSFDLTFIFYAAALFLLSYIFRYGAELQRQADETL